MSILSLSPWIKFLKLTPKASLPMWAGSWHVIGVRKAGVQPGNGSASAWSPSWDSTSGSSQEASVKSLDLFFFFTWPLYTLPTSLIKWQQCPLPLGSWYMWQSRCGTWTVDAWCDGGGGSPPPPLMLPLGTPGWGVGRADVQDHKPVPLPTWICPVWNGLGWGRG